MKLPTKSKQNKSAGKDVGLHFRDHGDETSLFESTGPKVSRHSSGVLVEECTKTLQRDESVATDGGGDTGVAGRDTNNNYLGERDIVMGGNDAATCQSVWRGQKI
mmetsp:Transcript_24426/g.49495  ORF Transcript_24426/g.49495 Transcript_24426/m.49495 type:complete len:105 (-) Transcript_24426:253-567(-)